MKKLEFLDREDELIKPIQLDKTELMETIENSSKFLEVMKITEVR